MAINNNQVYTLVRQAYADALGGSTITAQDLQGVIDTGDTTTTILQNRDAFTSALIMACAKNWFMDTSYRSEYRDVFFEDEREYGAIIQLISVQTPEVQQSHAWQTFTSGVSTAGTYTLYLPIVASKLYGKTDSWELPIAISDEQWDDAFLSADKLADFVAYIMTVVDNAIVCHLENMNALNRNNFIAEKFVAEADANIKGVHVVNLTDLYNSERSGNLATTEDFLASPDAMRFAAAKIDEYSTYFSKMSKMFNTEDTARFTPDDRKVVQVVKKFASAMAEVSYSTTYNADYVKLPNYEEVPFWQGFGSGISWDDVTSIDVETGTDGTAVSESNIVALIVDKWAIMHTIRKHRVPVTRFDPEAITQYYFQFRDSYMNNLGQNGVVFVVDDASTP